MGSTGRESRYYRPLGLHERYSLARAQAGVPATLTLVAKIKCDSVSTLCSRLGSNIDRLLKVFPLLSAGVTDDRSSQPGFYGRSESLSHTSVLQIRQGLPDAIPACKDNDTATLLLEEQLLECDSGEGGGGLSLLQGPMWRVIVYQLPEATHAWLVLSADHTITDGRGMATLFELLLAKDLELILPSSPLMDIPPASDKVFNVAPSLRFLVPVVWQELILPRLPEFMQRRIKISPPWPAHVPLSMNPASSSPQIDLVLLEEGAVEQLRRTAKAKNINTITPLLHSSALIALYSMLESGETISSETPMSLRGKAGSEATSCTGNFVSSAEWSTKPLPGMLLWSLTKEYAEKLVNPHTAQQGLWMLGMLSFIPNDLKDPPPKKDPFITTLDKVDKPTSWQQFFHNKMHSTVPYSSSFEVTNVGLIRTEMPVESFVWARSAIPMGSAYTVHVAGMSSKKKEVVTEEAHEIPSSSLSITVVTRKGFTDGATFASRMRKAIFLFSEGSQVPDDVTLSDMVKKIMH